MGLEYLPLFRTITDCSQRYKLTTRQACCVLGGPRTAACRSLYTSTVCSLGAPFIFASCSVLRLQQLVSPTTTTSSSTSSSCFLAFRRSPSCCLAIPLRCRREIRDGYRNLVIKFVVLRLRREGYKICAGWLLERTRR